MMKTVDMAIAKIVIGDKRFRLRRTSEPKVKQIAESIDRVGLLQPVIIWYEEGHTQPQLVFGHHRIEACRRLGLDVIACVEIAAKTYGEARLAAIAENLHR